jgi:micrococcal nuclease
MANIKRTLLIASFFYPWFLLSTAAQGGECRRTPYDEQVSVSRVFDGDTVQLEDGRHLRFIGINTPERGRDARPSEPLADSAKQHLESLLADSKSLWLVFDKDRKDRHGRLLAHPFLPDGRNLTRALLKSGLGFQITVPPNLLFLDCYQQAEHNARREQLGVWRQPYYQPWPAADLTVTTTGFRRVIGTVSRIGESRSAYWLNLGKNFALRMPKADLHYFPYAPSTLMGKTLSVRGWVYWRRDELRMQLRHPASIENIVETDSITK